MALLLQQEKEVTVLKGVNLFADETEVPFGSFTSLANWIPAGRSILKKKRGVVRLDNVLTEL